MKTKLKVDICILGAGSGGLSVASAATQLGIKVALIESDKMGGDCLNYGCIPSKALLAAAKSAQNFRQASKFGLTTMEPEVDFSKVMNHVQAVINKIAPHDSVARFEKLGVKVILAQGKFIDKNLVEAGDFHISASYFIIATGSSPSVPPIPHIKNITYYTNETIFNLNIKPSHLIIIGGGPIGCEMAQAFLYLGVKVTIIEAFKILPHDEEDLVSVLKQIFCNHGLELFESASILNIEQNNDLIKIQFEHQGQTVNISGSHLLLATGRIANIKNLNLEAAKVNHTAKSIVVDSRLRTSNHRIYALGDVIGQFQFTHIASYHASIIIRNILFKIPAKVNYAAIPWVTYTDPELAHAGLLSQDALKLDSKIKILHFDFKENDRAQTEHATEGSIKVITSAKGRVLGVSILGHNAGELLLPWILIISQKQKIRSLTNVIVPYPTLSEISKSVASDFYKPLLFSKKTKKIIQFLKYFW